MMRYWFFAFAVLLFAGMGVQAQEEADLRFFPFVKSVRMPASAVQGNMGAVIALDTEVLECADNPLTDCRVFTDSGEPVRFAVRSRQGAVRRTQLEPVEAYLALTGENTGVIKIPGGLDAPGPMRLEIRAENPYFAKFVSITARMPSGRTRKVLDHASIFSFSPPYPVVRNGVDFYAPAQAELTVAWTPGGDIPQKILRPDDTIPEGWSHAVLTDVQIRLYRVVPYQETAEVLTRYPLEYKADHVENKTIVSMACPKVPVTGFRLQTKTPFLFRQVQIYGGNERRDMQLLGEGTLARIAPSDKLSVVIPVHRCRYYELHIDNRDKSPLDDMVWTAEGPQLELVTEAPRENLLKLAFGRQTLLGRPPRYLPEKKVLCKLGNLRRNPDYVPPRRPFPPVGWYLLSGSLLLLPVLAGAGWLYCRKKRRKGAA